MYSRILDIQKTIQRKSIFLFGPRQTGKTTLLKKMFPNSLNYNLLLSDVFSRLSMRPSLLREEVLGLKKSGIKEPIIIDEIQKLPFLLDEVHSLIEETQYKFILTGSSPRKLKRGAANLLGGRAITRYLFPLVSCEIPGFDLIKVLNYGSLPAIYDSSDQIEDLEAYVGNYLQEEIQAEGAVRRIENFARFLHTAALVNGELLNFENVANDAQVPSRTVREYFYILEDTLIGSILHPYQKTKKRKAISTAKFYFFDIGVSNYLSKTRNIEFGSELFGRRLEHFIFCELKAYLSYKRDGRFLSFWRSVSQEEVDFLIGDELAIEVKSTNLVTERHLKGLYTLMEEKKFKKYFIISLDPKPRTMGKIEILPIAYFLKRLWDGSIDKIS